MNKTLSQYKPHERDSVLEIDQIERERFIATLNNDPDAAYTAYTKIYYLLDDHHNELEQYEQQRQYRESYCLAYACELTYYKALFNLNAEQQQLKQRQQEKLDQILEIQQTESERLEQKLNAYHPRKVQNKEYLQCMREYDKLMKLREFDRAASVKKLAEKMEHAHFGRLINDFDARNYMLMNYLHSRHEKELFILQQQFQYEQQNMEYHRAQRLFEIVQGCKNDKVDMDNAFYNEFIGYKYRCMDYDIVMHRYTQNLNGSTFKGSLKKQQVLASLKVE